MKNVLELESQDLPEKFVVILSVKRRVTDEHFIHEDPQ
jgi:hypothetical protein